MIMKLTPLAKLFDIKYGVNLELNKLEETYVFDDTAICFVSRTEYNNGVSAFVKKQADIDPVPPNTLTVAGGGSVLSTFLQPYPYYSGRDLFFLTPKKDMSERELIYYSICIQKNKYKYNYGRQANKTLKDILVPVAIPERFKNLNVDNLNYTSFSRKTMSVKDAVWKWFVYEDLFEVKIGKSVDLNKLELNEAGINYVGRTEENNGITARVTDDGSFEVYPGECITVPMVGNELKSSYQIDPFCVSQNIAILRPKNFTLNSFVAVFLNTIIRKDRFRFAYGRTLSLDRLKKLKIKLPVDKNGHPDWQFMEDYIKSLPYSASI